MNTLSCDLETYSPEPLPKTGVHRYVEHPDFEILLFGYSIDGADRVVIDLAQGEEIPDEIKAALFDPAVIKTAFNAAFEIACLSRHSGEQLPPEQWRCTSVLALTLGLPGHLADVAIACKLPQDKRKQGIGRALIKFFCTPCKATKVNGGRTRNLPHHDPARWALFVEYCGQDVVVEMAVREKLLRWAPNPTEQALWVLDQKINTRGWRIDRELVTAAIAIDETIKARATAEFCALTGIAKATQVAKLKAWLDEEHDIQTESLNKASVSRILGWMVPEAVEEALLLRQQLSKSSVSKYVAMARSVCADDYIRGLFQFYGANRTGRWAGRIVQAHNLPKSNLSLLELEVARALVKLLDIETLQALFDDPQALLSELIRSAFCPPPRRRFAVIDFAAIEARVLAWSAGCEWRLEVFRTHGKIYEASAAAMFKVPFESIGKKSPLRQKGKVSELALGYLGGVGALITMGALTMGLREDELQPLVDAWRAANPEIVSFGRQMEVDAKRCLRTKLSAGVPGKYLFRYSSGMLFMDLPSGRSLCYVKPRIEKSELTGYWNITYDGQDPVTKQWGRAETYGGKLCIAAGTPVLTACGWVPIETVTSNDHVFDGVEWVRTGGAIDNGLRHVIKAHGVWMTPDHQILTSKGWVSASQSERHNRAACRIPDGYPVPRDGRKALAVGIPLRMWDGEGARSVGDAEASEAGRQSLVRLHARGNDWREFDKARHVGTPSIWGVAKHDGPLRPANAPSLAKLWRQGNRCLRSLARFVRELLGGHGRDLPARAHLGPDGQRERLRSRELPVGGLQDPDAKHEKQPDALHTVGGDAFVAGRGTYRNWTDNSALPGQQQLASQGHVQAPEFEAQVFDILNCGPRARFVVADENGLPLIVHNCENHTQAVARDCLAVAMTRMDSAGLDICGHVHDETIVEVDENLAEQELDRAEKIFAMPISWAPGLPLCGDGFISTFYRKDA